MKRSFTDFGVLVAVLLAATANRVLAQPAGTAAGTAAGMVTNRPHGNQPGNDQNQALAAIQDQIKILNQRLSLIYAGITDTKVQDAILLDVNSQETRRQALQQKWSHLQETASNQQTTDTEVRDELTAFEAAVEEEKAKRLADEKTLDGLIGFSKDARMELHLIAVGIIGDDFVVATGNVAGFGRTFGQGFGYNLPVLNR